MFRVVSGVRDNVLSHKLIIKFQLLKRFLLLAEVPLVFFNADLLQFDQLGDALVLLLDIDKGRVQVESRLNCGSPFVPYFLNLRKGVRYLTLFVRTAHLLRRPAT